MGDEPPQQQEGRGASRSGEKPKILCSVTRESTHHQVGKKSQSLAGLLVKMRECHRGRGSRGGTGGGAGAAFDR